MNYVSDWSKYAPYFAEKEFACKLTGRCRMRVTTMDKTLALRLLYAKPMIITSGDRHPTHPDEAKKEFPGVHTEGAAFDTSVQGSDALLLIHLGYKVGFRGIGVHQKGTSRFLHFDDYEGDVKTPRPWIWSY